MEKELLEVQESEKGASLLEYALLAALVAVAAITAMTFLGQEASQTFSNVGSRLNAAGN